MKSISADHERFITELFESHFSGFNLRKQDNFYRKCREVLAGDQLTTQAAEPQVNATSTP